MQTTQSRAWKSPVGCCLAASMLSLCLANDTFGEIRSAAGQVAASVRQVNADTGQILDQAFEQTPGTTNILPAIATATLDIDPTGSLAAGRLTSTALVNPPEVVTAVTKDFSCEAAGLSLPSDRGFQGDAVSTEDRQVVFTAADLNLASGTPLRARSTLSLSGGVFLVTLPGAANDVSGKIQFTLRQTRAGQTQTLLSGTFTVFFDSAGQLQFTADGDAAPAIVVPFDFSTASSEISQARMITLPLISLPYEYDAQVDEPFTLTAEVRASCDAPTGLQGASAFVGQTPRSLIDILNDFLAVDLTTEIGATAGAAAAQKVALQDAAGTEIIPQPKPGCGNFGLEWLLGGAALAAGFVTRRFI